MNAIEVGPLRILPGENWVCVAGQRIRLSSKQRRLLVHLGWCARGYVTRRALSASLGYGSSGDCRNLDILICRTRKKLELASGGTVGIRAINGHGYTLCA